MTEEDRRSLHQLIARAADQDALACLALEEKALALSQADRPDDAAYLLQMLSLHGLDLLRERIVARWQEDHHRFQQQWPMIA